MKMELILVLLIGIFSSGCEKEDPKPELVLPTDLSVNVEKEEENPGKILLDISSKNTNYYLIYFGENENETPLNTTNKVVEYTYGTSGDFIITIQAHATANAYISETVEINIDLPGGENQIPTSGYSTPEEYSGYTLVWRDEFEGDQLSTSDWSYEQGNGDNGWGNEELQFYRQENTTVGDGMLIITAKEEKIQGFDYTSSRIITKEKQEFQYGRIDIRAALPNGQGIWPALWMLGGNIESVSWPSCGEIDIMELIGGGEGRDDKVHGTIHWSNNGEYANYGKGYNLQEGIFSDEFHVFTIIWDENTIKWYVDDNEFNVVDITPEALSEFHQEFFIIFNVAVGGRWPGSPNASTEFPQRMIVDYVRVFQKN